MGMWYVCSFSGCLHKEESAFENPLDNGPVAHYMDWKKYRLRCSACGSFAVPEVLRNCGTGTGAAQEMQLCQSFSACPAAYWCRLQGNYAPECEEGRIRLACLAGLHMRLDILEGVVQESQTRKKRG